MPKAGAVFASVMFVVVRMSGARFQDCGHDGGCLVGVVSRDWDVWKIQSQAFRIAAGLE